MDYATQQDIEDRYGASALVDRDGDGQPDMAAVAAALTAATEEINSYLGRRYAVPLATVPGRVREVCVEIALYLMHREGTAGAEDYRPRYEDAQTWLRDVAAGRAVVPELEAAGEAPTNDGRPETSGPPRRWSRETMKGW